MAAETNPEIIVFVGNACENFLVKVAADQNPAISLAGATGIITKADKLRAGKAIAAKHLGFFQYIGNIRNAADHGIDTDINAQWSLSPDTVRQSVLVCLACIRSVVGLSHASHSL
jgi:hypothetical protein